jgi:hypothetical protein
MEMRSQLLDVILYEKRIDWMNGTFGSECEVGLDEQKSKKESPFFFSPDPIGIGLCLFEWIHKFRTLEILYCVDYRMID